MYDKCISRGKTLPTHWLYALNDSGSDNEARIYPSPPPHRRWASDSDTDSFGSVDQIIIPERVLPRHELGNRVHIDNSDSDDDYVPLRHRAPLAPLDSDESHSDDKEYLDRYAAGDPEVDEAIRLFLQAINDSSIHASQSTYPRLRFPSFDLPEYEAELTTSQVPPISLIEDNFSVSDFSDHVRVPGLSCVTKDVCSGSSGNYNFYERAVLHEVNGEDTEYANECNKANDNNETDLDECYDADDEREEE